MNILSKALLGALFFRKLLKEAKKDRVTCDGFEEEASFYEKSWLEKDFLFSKFIRSIDILKLSILREPRKSKLVKYLKYHIVTIVQNL